MTFFLGWIAGVVTVIIAIVAYAVYIGKKEKI